MGNFFCLFVLTYIDRYIVWFCILVDVLLMNKVQVVKLNSSQKAPYSTNMNTAKGQSFKGAASEAAEEAAKLTTQQEGIIFNTLIQKYLGKVGKFLSYLSQTAGEVQNLIIIGIGTAFFAPIFIAFNPISHQDKETKEYSALRQPISAVIATAFGLGINIPIERQVKKWAAEGKLSMFDMSAKQPEDYLKAKYNSIIKNFGHLKPEEQKCLDTVNDGSIKTVADFKEKFPNFQEFVNATHAKTLSAAAESILDPNNPKGLRKRTVKDLFIENLDFEESVKDKNCLNPDSVMERLTKIKAMPLLRNLLGFSELTESGLRTIVNKKNTKDLFSEQQSKSIARVSESFISEEVKNEETIHLKTLIKIVLGVDEKTFYKNQRILNMTIEEFLFELRNKLGIELKDSQGREISKEEYLAAHARKIIEYSASQAEKRFKAYSKIQGIMLSLITLPFSCGLLNWAYPRIMDKYFPSLSKPNGADKKGGK